MWSAFHQLGVVLFFVFIITQSVHRYLASPLALNMVVVDPTFLEEEAPMDILAKKSLTNPQL